MTALTRDDLIGAFKGLNQWGNESFGTGLLQKHLPGENTYTNKPPSHNFVQKAIF